MTNFYTNEYLEKIKRQKNKLLTIYFIILAVCVLIEVVVIGFNAYLPYMHEYKTLLTIILYATGVLFTVFSFLYLQITYGKVSEYYKFVSQTMIKRKTTSSVTVIRIHYQTQTNKIDYYTIDVLEWSNTENDYVERTVLVDCEFKDLDFKVDEILTITTSSNFLTAYKRSDL